MLEQPLFDDLPIPAVDNKFHNGNGEDGKHYWLTDWTDPKIAALVAEFGPFDFDPCPFPKPPKFDGLLVPWGKRNWVNPPFGSFIGSDGKKKGMTAWMRKAIAERDRGNLSVIVFPLDKWVLLAITEIFGDTADIRNLGDQRWLAIEDGSRGKGLGRHIAAFILKPNGLKPAPAARDEAELISKGENTDG